MNKPEKKFKAGAISATIWVNDNGENSYSTVSLERTYKDKQGAWKSTNSLRINDIPKASVVLNKAYEYIISGSESISQNKSQTGSQI